MILGIGFAFALINKAIDNAAKQELLIVPQYEERERMERRTNKVFDKNKDDDRTDLYSRFRPGFKFTYGQEISGQLTYQYAHDWYWVKTGNGSTDNSDLLLGYVSYAYADGKTTVGRQRLIKGNERLLGESGWNNVSNSFDLVRYQWNTSDFFVGKVGVTASESDEQRIGGASYDSGLGESMIVGTHNRVKGATNDIATLDQLYKVKFGRTSFDLEAAGQLGHKADVQNRAWALSGRVTENFTPKISGFLEANAASGGKLSDGTTMAFNNLYPTNHQYYGTADLQGWSNMGEIAAEAGYKLKPELKLSAEYHHYWLHDATDAWYGNSGSINKIGSSNYVDASGAYGKDVGQEISLQAEWAYTSNKQISAGIADFMPGRFVESFIPAGTAIRQIWAFAQVNVKF